MERKTCSCDYTTTNPRKWDADLDVCKTCSKKKKGQQSVLDYLNGFEVGDLVSYSDNILLIVSPHPTHSTAWIVQNFTTNRRHVVDLSGWIYRGDLRDCRETVYKLDESE